MADYAAAAVQPIVQGLVTIPSNTSGNAYLFSGRGCTPVQTPPAARTVGVIILTLDVGLPGNAGAVEPLPDVNGVPLPAGPLAPLPRTLITMRSPSAGAATTLDSISVAYGNFTVPTPADGSLTQIAITLATSGGVLTDPVTTTTPPAANGFEIVVFAGVESP